MTIGELRKRIERLERLIGASEWIEPPSPEAQVYTQGKEVLGQKSGGLITKLIKAHGLDETARLLVQASGKSDPVEWIAGVIRNGSTMSGEEIVNKARGRDDD